MKYTTHEDKKLAKKRLNIIFDQDIYIHLIAHVPPRKRNRFIQEAVERSLQWQEQQNVREQMLKIRKQTAKLSEKKINAVIQKYRKNHSIV